jgi:DNA polymerase elongation subunit (family B)
MRHIEDVPWWICDEGDNNNCIYSDTDSIYVHAEPLLRFLFEDFDEMPSDQKDNELEKIALYYQDYITDSYSELALNCFNIPTHRLEMKTEAVIRSAYFRATRRYAQWITKQEGIVKEKLDIKGLEYKKANFPKVLGKFFQQTLEDVLKGLNKEEVDKRVLELRTQILDGSISLIELGNPTAVKKLTTYTGRKPKPGEMFTQLLKGAPVGVKAAVAYNDLIRFWKLNDKHSYIAQGDKIKYIYLKPNPYQLETIGILDFDLPEKVREFMETYADRQKIFDSIMANKLEGFYMDLGWSYNLNTHINKFFTF